MHSAQKYRLGCDYFILDPNDTGDKQIIDASFGAEMSAPKDHTKNARGGRNRLYYAIICNCLKDLIMRVSTPSGAQLRAGGGEISKTIIHTSPADAHRDYPRT